MLEESATRIRVQGCEGVGVGWWRDKNHREGGEEDKKKKVKREKKWKGGGCLRKREVEELVARGACGADPDVYGKNKQWAQSQKEMHNLHKLYINPR